ncbi:putative ectoine synthase [Shimwellia blattae DSM 4481 = NBRC 105725]|uniref:L-ectoine synthase n=2 Tax=Shimwellia blattae TaxID=563 RepID=I2BCF4_SHIBC|nr:ectoine synthase [Shimwellia blattae]AFJ48208.1 putative ectoine synthase [Shimwellia blattae DSM 4481 = NBRC 105725]VDY65704.1 L-ectoine synthase [Shimwellia blattae]VEC25442.1 L-ectoine synthase [Shimwellia blattae]
MFIRTLRDVAATAHFVDWGNGTSHRLLTRQDNMGFTLCHTVVTRGSESLLEYKNHLEACYCIAGEGEIENMAGERFPIVPGTIYVLNEHDRHYLRACVDQDLILVSVFNPPLEGTETHALKTDGASAY